jgi:hypothetical protein
MQVARPLAIVAALLSFLFAVFFASPARGGDRELIVPFHEGGRIVFDQLSGMRVDPNNGISYAGPAGVAFHTEKADAFAPGAPGAETKTTTFWVAPSADVFVTDHLSVGGLIQFAHTSGTTSTNGQQLELPGSTSMTFLPRVGFYVPFSDRLGLWPRLGFGWTSVDSVVFASAGGAPVTDTFRSMLLDVDLSLVYRFSETFFLRTGPEIGVTVGGRHTQDVAGTSAAADASVLHLSGTIGFGANLDL